MTHRKEEQSLIGDGGCALLSLGFPKLAFLWCVHIPRHVVNAPGPLLPIDGLDLSFTIFGRLLHPGLILLLFPLVGIILLVIFLLSNLLLSLGIGVSIARLISAGLVLELFS